MTIETERLILRNWREEDGDSMYEYAKDPDVGPIAGWPAHQSAEESRKIVSLFRMKPECYAICLKPSDQPIGTVELKLYGSSDLVHSEKECELGYWLGKPFWGNGIMPEGVRALLNHAFEDCGMERVWCAHYEGNNKSRRVMEKCGFTYRWTSENIEVPLLKEYRTGHVLCLERQDWEKGSQK